jgi:hypothetical protein
MKNITKYAAMFAATALVFASCKKEETTEEPTPTPAPKVEFTITNPTDGGTYHLGDTVWVNVHIDYATELHGYEASIVNTSNSDEVVWESHLHDHGDMFMVEGFWVNNVTMHSDMELRIEAFIDHDGNSETETVHFHCHPM